nr:MAG TPA: hypothetical protein [Caudoviricetes sp.]
MLSWFSVSVFWSIMFNAGSVACLLVSLYG